MIFEAPGRFRPNRFIQACEDQLEGVLDVVIDSLKASHLVALSHSAGIALWHKPVKGHPIL